MRKTRQPESRKGSHSARSWISFRSALVLAALIPCSLGAIRAARADDLLGLYVGAAFGQAHIRVQPGQVIPGSSGALDSLDMTHSAFKAIVGVRPLPFLGAEVSYMDFGKVSSLNGQVVAGAAGYQPFIAQSEQASQKGESAFALLYLPVPIIDIYVKAGLSRITTDYNVTYLGYLPGVGTCAINVPNCSETVLTASRDSTDTGFAYGAGLQWKLGPWAVRGEYERFDAAGANPSLFSIGMTYWLQ